jgi:uncharacterized integral membrane protein
MKAIAQYYIPAAVAIGVGAIILVSYFITVPVLVAVRLVLTDWAVILGGLAVLAGVLNLIMIHSRRVQAQARGWVYSLLTAVVALLTFIVGAIEGALAGSPTLYQEGSVVNTLFNGVLVASQATLAGLVMFFLVAAAVRMLRSKPNHWSIIFLVVVVVVLIGWLPFGFMGSLNSVREWLISVPASGGARGILLGVGLGTLAVGLRVIMGVETPYKD